MSVSMVSVAIVMRVVKVRMLPSEQQAAALGGRLGQV
jgi:hypothetical protein